MSDAEIERCYSAIAQLRSHLSPQAFVEQVKRQQTAGYHLAYLENSQTIQSVAGFYIRESLSWSRYLYLEDLITCEEARSQGYGSTLFQWLVDFAKAQQCQQIHLDSGVTRYAAHRFYLNRGMVIAGYHFAMTLHESP